MQAAYALVLYIHGEFNILLHMHNLCKQPVDNILALAKGHGIISTSKLR